MRYTAKFPNVAAQKKFLKELSKIPKKDQVEILEAIKKLESDPRPFGKKSFKQLAPPLEFYQHVAQYRVRVGSYRVLYDVEDHRQIVWIFAVRKKNESTYRT